MNDRPIDPVSTAAWSKLTSLARDFNPDLKVWFDGDPNRVEQFTLRAGDLYVDLSKNLITPAIVDALVEMADQVGLEQRRDAMFRGDHVNATEDRPALHTALRTPAGQPLIVAGQDVNAQVHDELTKMYAFANRVRAGDWLGATGKPISTVVNIGIGGSDLGPVMAYEALAPFRSPKLQCRFLSNIDPTDSALTLAGLDPETTLFIVSSKTFTTLETLTNARLCKTWLIEALGMGPNVVEHHFAAVSTALDHVADFGINPENAFGFWDWVGGRYSLDSAIGTSLAIAIGPDHFNDLLSGMHLIDEHFRCAPLSENLPVLMGLLNVWYDNFLGAQTHAVLPYSQLLHRFPAYLQQLTMESNGKGVRWDGSPVTTQTGEVFWGEPGTNGQHAFYQLIHQGTKLIPADFIGFANPSFPTQDGDVDVHQLLLANFMAQTQALAFGKSLDEVRAEGTPEWIAPARVFSGNRPSTTIMAPALTPSTLGQLIALYEHITFTQGVVWGIDSFDQWGVELGKVLALRLAPALNGDQSAVAAQDPSTRSLIDYYRSNRSEDS